MKVEIPLAARRIYLKNVHFVTKDKGLPPEYNFQIFILMITATRIVYAWSYYISEQYSGKELPEGIDNQW